MTGARSRPGPQAPGLRRLLDELGVAKGRLLTETAALREIDQRVRAWDLSQPFQARRGLALRARAAVRFAEALDALEALLGRLAREHLGGAPWTRPRSPRTRRLLLEIHAELRYLQRAFDGGSLLLANALASFSAAVD